jgi:hypothetical protein
MSVVAAVTAHDEASSSTAHLYIHHAPLQPDEHGRYHHHHNTRVSVELLVPVESRVQALRDLYQMQVHFVAAATKSSSSHYNSNNKSTESHTITFESVLLPLSDDDDDDDPHFVGRSTEGHSLHISLQRHISNNNDLEHHHHSILMGSLVIASQNIVYQFRPVFSSSTPTTSSSSTNNNSNINSYQGQVIFKHASFFGPEVDGPPLPQLPSSSSSSILSKSNPPHVRRRPVTPQQQKQPQQSTHFDATPNSNNNNNHTHHRSLQTPSPALPTIDLLLVWTKEVECRLAQMTDINTCVLTDATTAQVRALMDLAVSETNTAYSLSGIHARVRLVHATRDDAVVTTSMTTALQDLSTMEDGILDRVHTLRTQYGADSVGLFMHTTDDKCGQGYLGYPRPSAQSMFFVVQWDCATGYYSLGHELGHNLVCTCLGDYMVVCLCVYIYTSVYKCFCMSYLSSSCLLS